MKQIIDREATTDSILREIFPETRFFSSIKECVAFCNDVPKTVDDLTTMAGLNHAIFYTVWSRKPGYGRMLVVDLWKYLLMTEPHIQRFVTLSPKTKMAWKFHINNGAILLNENEESDNYEYKESELVKDDPNWHKEKLGQ